VLPTLTDSGAHIWWIRGVRVAAVVSRRPRPGCGCRRCTAPGPSLASGPGRGNPCQRHPKTDPLASNPPAAPGSLAADTGVVA